MEWDYMMLPDIGFINRLSILGFVSNSLAIMVLPFSIYFMYKINSGKYLYIFYLFLSTAITLLTFSRTGLYLLIFSICVMFWRNITLLVLLVIPLILLLPNSVFELLSYSFLRDKSIFENPRVRSWLDALKDYDWSNLFLGMELLKPPLDNT